MAISKLVALKKEYDASVELVIKDELLNIDKHLKKAAEIYKEIQDSKAGVDVWGSAEIKPLLTTLNLIERKEAGNSGKEEVSKRLTKEKKKIIKPIIVKIVNAHPKGIKRGDIQEHNDIKLQTLHLGFAQVPNLALVIKELIKEKKITPEGDKATTVYKPM